MDDGQLSGLKVTDELLQSLGSLRSEGNIQPMPALTLSRFSLTGGDVAVVEVLPADLPPVRYKGRVYVRVGPRRATASEQVGEGRESMPVPYSGELLEIGFNADFLREGVEGIEGDEVRLGLISPLRPGLLRGESEDHRYLLMPIRLPG